MQPSPLIDSYIEAFPLKTIQLLNQVRRTIQQLVPDAEETMKYGIPTYVFHGNLVHFAGYKNHIGFYPGAAGIEAFKEQFKDYEWSKGAVQFPIDKPMPLKLITQIVKYRIQQNLEKSSRSKQQRTCVNGHRFIKTSDCPTCPQCEATQKPSSGFLSTLGAPARRALEREGIGTLKKLSKYSVEEVLQLHGIGKTSIPKLIAALQSEGLSFKS
jgi:uncharacterized protein YdhG (YjbR/CyaY superfamily)